MTNSTLLVMTLLTVTAASACAQSNGPSTPGGVAGSAAVQSPSAGETDARFNQRGWTGRTLVPGSSSSIADNAVATRMQQTGQYGPQR